MPKQRICVAENPTRRIFCCGGNDRHESNVPFVYVDDYPHEYPHVTAVLTTAPNVTARKRVDSIILFRIRDSTTNPNNESIYLQLTVTDDG